MNRLDKLALAAVLISTVICLRSAIEASEAYAMARPISRTKAMIGYSGWFIATFGPTLLAVAFWRWAKQSAKPLVFHLLFLPCAIVAFRAGEALMLSVIGDPDFDATLGGPVMQAYLLFVAAAGSYVAALTSRLIPAARARR